jgi:hypothetical protein
VSLIESGKREAFPAIEELSGDLLLSVDHDGGRLTRHRVNAITYRVGFTLHSVPQPAAIDSVGDRPCWPTDLSAD